ncbi:purine nucleosidase/pyrimidine-specific ribonucleoside hydrolase [Kibdelosporangium banguiense]|uniref:Purine nucleosidase/pyrimidine-specific ribonucleoside hydrolase n=1 Tax=Kibdelosporangium banguiense TaxID=1365924 RepID=A0ABS4TQI3_9PSEU|nr:nucleoside hydrolase [Kibdelosporangium banguiense]MBP2326168.1 purine nucleosidase/pyrimidine-specific ribonucleoside hydrolase [Kibdelosporangium banguiense]
MIPVVLDCDPGHDDVFAILLAAAHPGIDLRAITTVAGNGTLDQVTRNALRVCTLAGITGIPVAAGAASDKTAPRIHGASALDGADLPEPADLLSSDGAVAVMERLLEQAPLTIVATGPLTNVAALLERRPDLRPEIVLMGGSCGRGNWRPLAEFNIWADPEAADRVFTSGLPVTMCGLDVTHQALATPDVFERLRAMATPLADTMADLLRFFASTYDEVFGMPDPPVHDPVAVAAVAKPSLLKFVDAPVAVELDGTHTRGATVVDLHGITGRPANVRVAVELDRPGFWDMMLSAIERLGRAA